MASARTLSPFIVNLSLDKLENSSSSPPPANLSFHYNGTGHSLITNLNKTHRHLSICLAQLNYGSAGDDPEEIDEEFFDDGVDGGALVDDISDDEDDTDSSIDLLIRFLQTMFKKVSKRAKKASRSILPAAISPQLVSFAVDGILLLASLSIVKALLEVICTIGGTVFVVILLLRVVWAAISYFQSSGNRFNQGGSSFATI